MCASAWVEIITCFMIFYIVMCISTFFSFARSKYDTIFTVFLLLFSLFTSPFPSFYFYLFSSSDGCEWCDYILTSYHNSSNVSRTYVYLFRFYFNFVCLWFLFSHPFISRFYFSFFRLFFVFVFFSFGSHFYFLK